eukprot:10138377-Karenia_brevis.AAC.1
MSSAVAVSDGPSPYYAPGIALPYDGLSTQEAPQGLSTRGFKWALEYSEVPDSPTRSKAKMMETKIFTSHPVMQDTLQTAVQGATIEATQDFEAKLTKAVYGMGQGSSKEQETCPDTGDNLQGSANSCTPRSQTSSSSPDK